MPCFWMNKTWKSALWEMQFSKNIWGLGELYFEDCKVLNYLTFIYLCFMYVITAIGFSMNHVPHAQQHACQAYEHLLLVSRWITRLFIIRKHLQPHASFLNHHVSFLFPPELNTLLKHFLDAPCLFLHSFPRRVPAFSRGEFNQDNNTDGRETWTPQRGFSAYVSMINKRFGDWAKGEWEKDGERMHKKVLRACQP